MVLEQSRKRLKPPSEQPISAWTLTRETETNKWQGMLSGKRCWGFEKGSKDLVRQTRLMFAPPNSLIHHSDFLAESVWSNVQ